MPRQRYTDVERIKAAVRERDGMRCTKCRRTNDESISEWGCSLTIHRVTPGSIYSLDAGVCVTLCKICHGPQPVSPHRRLVRSAAGIRFVSVPKPQREEP